MKKQKYRKCKECKKRFFSTRADNVYCSIRCQNRYWCRNHPRVPKSELKRVKEALRGV